MSSKNKFCWNKELTLSLIELYHNYSVLYAVRLCDYKNKTKRLAAINEIKEQLITASTFAANQCLDTEDIKVKIHNLRTQFLKEAARLASEKRSGAAGDIKPKLWCYEHLTFLKDSDIVTPSTSNADDYNTEMDINLENEVIFDGNVEDIENVDTGILSRVSEQSTSSTKKRKSSTLEKCTSAGIHDDLYIFGRTVEAELRGIKNKKILRNTKMPEMKMMIHKIN